MYRTEAQLDAILAGALLREEAFANWFLGRTRFSRVRAACVECRHDNPWSSVRLEKPSLATGEVQLLSKQCETDVLAIFTIADDRRRIALHIENKLAGGSFTPDQPELYRARLAQWSGREKLGRYEDATSVLVSPQSFFDRHEDQARIFESHVSHEDIARWLPDFAADGAGGNDAVRAARR